MSSLEQGNDPAHALRASHAISANSPPPIHPHTAPHNSFLIYFLQLISHIQHETNPMSISYLYIFLYNIIVYILY